MKAYWLSSVPINKLVCCDSTTTTYLQVLPNSLQAIIQPCASDSYLKEAKNKQNKIKNGQLRNISYNKRPNINRPLIFSKEKLRKQKVFWQKWMSFISQSWKEKYVKAILLRSNTFIINTLNAILGIVTCLWLRDE
jgi:hypothetical protein